MKFENFLNETKTSLNDLKSIKWMGSYSYGHYRERLYRLYVYDKNKKQVDVRDMKEFNEMFGTDFDKEKGYDEFEKYIKKLAPHIDLNLDYYDTE